MLAVAICLAFILIILIISEYLSRTKQLKKEYLRKFVHVSVGVFVAFWPWLMSWQTIQIISLAFLVVVFISRQFNVFSALKSVKRTTYGDVFFALAVGICAVITNDPVIFCIAMLMMAIADGVAALIGNKYGGSWGYQVVRQHKTVIGSMSFWLISLIILGIGLLFMGTQLSYGQYALTLIFLPPLLTLLENIMPYGSDNLAVPVAVVSFITLI